MYSSLLLPFGLLGVAYGGAYFHVENIINEVLQGNYRAGVPLAIILMGVGIVLHHQRQLDPIKEA